MNLRALVRRYPVATFFLLAFAIAWTGSLTAAGPKFLRGEQLDFADSVAMALPMMLGPSLAGILVTAIVDGMSGVMSLFRRMIKWQAGTRWYVALLIFPTLILIVLLALTIISSDFAPDFLLIGIAAGLLAGFFEEIGWTGFAYPRMRQKAGVLLASLFLGGLHAIWHLAPDYVGASGVRGDFWLAHFLAFAVFVVALRVLIVWVYTNTGSVLLAQLMHASSTGFLLILVPLSLSPAYDTLFYVLYSIVLWGVVAVVLATHGRGLALKQ